MNRLGVDRCAGLSTLAEGAKVTFDIVDNRGKEAAENLRAEVKAPPWEVAFKTGAHALSFSRPLCLPQCECVAELTSARRRSFCHAIRKPLSLCFAARDPTRPARVQAVRSDHAQSVGRSWSYWPLSPSPSDDGREDI
jgi:hypothetical protein